MSDSVTDPTREDARALVIALLRTPWDAPTVDTLIGVIERTHALDEARRNAASYNQGWADCHAAVLRLQRAFSREVITPTRTEGQPVAPVEDT